MAFGLTKVVGVSLTPVCLCIPAPIYHLGAVASIQTQTQHVTTLYAKQIGAHRPRKACLGLVILKLKACLLTQH